MSIVYNNTYTYAGVDENVVTDPSDDTTCQDNDNTHQSLHTPEADVLPSQEDPSVSSDTTSVPPTHEGNNTPQDNTDTSASHLESSGLPVDVVDACPVEITGAAWCMHIDVLYNSCLSL